MKLMSMNPMMMNRPSTRPRGGHYPGHLRGEFEEALWEYRGHQKTTPVARLLRASRAVWNCTDCLPNDVFVYAHDIAGVEPKRRTYAALARAICTALERAERDRGQTTATRFDEPTPPCRTVVARQRAQTGRRRS